MKHIVNVRGFLWVAEGYMKAQDFPAKNVLVLILNVKIPTTTRFKNRKQLD